MGKKRVLAGYGIDVDAVAGHINTTDGSRPNTSNVSRGSPEEFTNFRDVMEKSIQILTDFCGGKRPRGFTAPYWDPHPQQISIMEELGLLYDHSFMHDDFHAYYAPKDGETHTTTDYSKDASAWMKPSITEGPSDIVVIPGNLASPESPGALTSRLLQGLKVDVSIQNAAILLPVAGTEIALSVTIGLASLLVPGAVVVNIGSGVESMTQISDSRVTAEYPAYSIGKAALNMLTAHQAAKLKGKAIVVCVALSHVKTKIESLAAKMEVTDSASNVLRTFSTFNNKDTGKSYNMMEPLSLGEVLNTLLVGSHDRGIDDCITGPFLFL
ncbi:hypothetical protein AUP68_07245 [Ilyonectria robusta]